MNIKSILSFIAKLSKRERVIFYATIGVVGLVLLDKFVLAPILSKIHNLTEAIRVQEDEIRQSVLIVSQEGKVEEETKRFQSYLSAPTTEEKTITEFLTEVENIAKQSSVYLVDMKPTAKTGDSASAKYYVRVNFEAQMEQVMNFFYYVTVFKKLIKIEEFQLRPKTEGSTIISCNIYISKAVVTE